ncbi:MAG TPA: hypothetical protein VF574_01100 [Allosphingosinicella sp.]|jgi:hypothetical protein
MRFLGLALAGLLALTGTAGVAAPEADIVVQGGIERAEIERILRADNVDTSRLSEREVAEIIRGVERGRAPEDFWVAYQAHVLAWKRLAAAVEKAGGRSGESRFEESELLNAQLAIEATFDEVERIARAYGARLPTPAWSIPETV